MMETSQERIQLRRRLISLLPEMRSMPLEDLVTNTPLKWPIKQRLFLCLFEKAPSLQEQHNTLLDLLEERNKELAERRSKGLNNARREVNSEKEANFRTVFLRTVISGLERVKWPIASIPFSDPLNDLLHDDSTFVNAVDFLITIIDPSLRFSTSDDTVSTNASKAEDLHTQPSTPSSSKSNRNRSNLSTSSKRLSSGQPIPTFPANVTITSSHCASSVGQQSIESFASPSSKFEQESGICARCQCKIASANSSSNPSFRAMEILQMQNQNLVREVRRLEELNRSREQGNNSLRDSVAALRKAINIESCTDSSGNISERTIPFDPQQVSKCLQMLENSINQDRSSLQRNDVVNIEQRFRSTRLQSALDNKLFGGTQAFPHDEDDKSELLQFQNELLRFSEEIGILENHNRPQEFATGDQTIRLRNLRNAIFRLFTRICRATGQQTLSSENMERSSIWKLTQILASADRKSIPKHLLNSLTKECDGVLSEFNLISNTVQAFYGRNKQWQIVSNHILVSLKSIKKHVQAFGRVFHEEISPALLQFTDLFRSFQMVSKAKIQDKKSGNLRSVLDLLLNGAMGAEVAEFMMIFRERSEMVGSIPSQIDHNIKTFCKHMEAELGKISSVLNS